MTAPSILERVQAGMAAAMKARETETLSTLRMLKAALMEAKTRKPKEATLSAEEEIEVLQRYAKKRREAIEEFRRLNLPDRIASEEREIEVTKRYLPESLGEDEVRVLVKETVAATGAATPKDLGRVMGVLMGKVKGRADGALVSRLVKEALGG